MNRGTVGRLAAAVLIAGISVAGLVACAGNSPSPDVEQTGPADDPNTKVIHVQVDGTTVPCILWDGPGVAGSVSCGWSTTPARLPGTIQERKNEADRLMPVGLAS